MRMLEYTLNKYDLSLISKHTSKTQAKDWIVPQDIYEDIITVLKLGPDRIVRYLTPFKKLYEKATDDFSNGTVTNFNEALEHLFNSRRDIIEFAEGEFIRDLRADINMTYEEKVETILKTMEIILDSMLKQSNNNQNQQQNAPQPTQSSGTNSSGGSVKQSNPYGAFGNLLNTLAKPQVTNTKSNGFCRNQGPQNEDDLYNSSKDRQKLAELVKTVYSNNSEKLFKLARNFSLSLKGKDDHEYHEVPIGDTTRIRKMRNMKDIKYIRKQDWALDDDILDVKIAKKNLLIEHPAVRSDKAQLIYVLADTSGSMECPDIREHFMKAVLISLGRNAVEIGNKLWFRFFTGDVGPLYKLEGKDSWFDFLSKVLDRQMDGGTNIHKALSVAGEDILKGDLMENTTEIVLITDGTETLNPDEIKERVKVPIHTVCLDKISGSTLSNYKKSFTSLIINTSETIDDAIKNGLELIKEI